MSNKTYPEHVVKTSWESKAYNLLFTNKLSAGSTVIDSATLEAYSLVKKSSTVLDANVTSTFLSSTTGQVVDDETNENTAVRFKVIGGTNGVDYLVKCRAMTDTGDRLEAQTIVRVRDV